jgi:hypothetical protein
MKTEEAFEILNKYFRNEELKAERRRNKLDNSETDTIKEHSLWSDLLREKARTITDAQEKEKILDAAKHFEELSNQEMSNR